MKQLELNLNKRLLIVELPEDQEANYKEDVVYKIDEEQSKYSLLPKGEFTLVCKGSELTEDVVSKLVLDHEFYDRNMGRSYHGYKDYKENDYALQSALESFISAVNASGHHWGENPVKEPTVDDFTYNFHQNNGAETINWDDYDFTKKQWQKSESRTINPEKCIIFEIL